jgi:glycosyltransferase involved in cell wall biosynthesis
MVLIEVANIGELPVLSTDCPTGPSELLEEEFLSDVDKEEELSENMIKMIKNSTYRDKNLSLLKSRKHLFSHETISSEWSHLFETWSS